MKTLLITFFLLITSISFAQNWTTDFNQAKQQAKEENKKIILVFQGSDWCAPCIKLDQEIWQSDAFKKFAATHYVMLKADFPRRRKNKLAKEQQKKNDALAEKFNPNGNFPLVVVFNHEGKVLKKLSYEAISPKDYIDKIEQ